MNTVPTDHTTKNGKSARIWRRILLVLGIFVAVGALFGGGIAVVQPHSTFMGAELLVPLFGSLPLVGPYITSLLIPGSALLLFIFVPQTLAAVLLLKRRSVQYHAVIISGTCMAVFTIVELILIPNFLSWVYLAFGVTEIIAGLWCLKQARLSS